MFLITVITVNSPGEGLGHRLPGQPSAMPWPLAAPAPDPVRQPVRSPGDSGLGLVRHSGRQIGDLSLAVVNGRRSTKLQRSAKGLLQWSRVAAVALPVRTAAISIPNNGPNLNMRPPHPETMTARPCRSTMKVLSGGSA
jgi:hypothetical protein